MSTAVLERTREIGILLAIGWRKYRIVMMVLLESAIYGFLGGIIGIILGSAMMKLLLTFPAIQGFIVVDQNSGASTFKRLERNALEHWLEDYGMGDIWTKNLIGGRPEW